MTVLDQIQDCIRLFEPIQTLIEVGPGMGALTQKLLELNYKDYYLIEKDDRFVAELPKKFQIRPDQIIHKDVLEVDLSKYNETDLTIVGNYPYNISNLIMFWIIEQSEYVQQSVGMFQKEVAKRVSSIHGKKDYGILSVLTQSKYTVEYIMDIPAVAFDPPPKVVSGVIRMKRRDQPLADYKKLKKLVKMAFNMRRKMLSNSLKGAEWTDARLFEEVRSLRPEQLSLETFCDLSNHII